VYKGIFGRLWNGFFNKNKKQSFCFWTIPTILVGIAMIVIGLGHGYFQRRRENDFEEELEEEEKS
jgi:cytochrome c-type biogenesis protein CcmH/NrfF